MAKIRESLSNLSALLGEFTNFTDFDYSSTVIYYFQVAYSQLPIPNLRVQWRLTLPSKWQKNLSTQHIWNWINHTLIHVPFLLVLIANCNSIISAAQKGSFLCIKHLLYYSHSSYGSRALLLLVSSHNLKNKCPLLTGWKSRAFCMAYKPLQSELDCLFAILLPALLPYCTDADPMSLLLSDLMSLATLLLPPGMPLMCL